MNVTDGDRERAVRVLVSIPDSTDRVGTMAQALAEERERARAELQPIVDELRADERDGIPPHVPLLISALESFIAAEETE